MTTPNAKEIKKTLKNAGVNVLRSVTFGETVTVTVDRNHGEKAKEIIVAMGLLQRWSKFEPAKTPIVNHCFGWSEFTSLVSL